MTMDRGIRYKVSIGGIYFIISDKVNFIPNQYVYLWVYSNGLRKLTQVDSKGNLIEVIAHDK